MLCHKIHTMVLSSALSSTNTSKLSRQLNKCFCSYVIHVYLIEGKVVLKILEHELRAKSKKD